jgi:YHS domain-containing protein
MALALGSFLHTMVPPGCSVPTMRRRRRLPTQLLALGLAAATHECGDPSLGPVLGGVDFVATMMSGDPKAAPTMGSSAFNDSALGGYTFFFDNEANLDAFRANRTKYAPKYGGY